MKLIDLHVHSTFSDGELTPLQILDVCKKNGIGVVSITDHENLIGSKVAISNNPYSDITVIPGIELEADYSNGQCHILGYNMSLDNERLNNITKDIMLDNINRIKSLIVLLYEHYKIKFDDKDLEVMFSKEGNIGRPEVAKLCVKYGYSETVESAFKQYLRPLKKKLKQEIKLSHIECIDYIKNAGGLVSLAHPITLKKDDEELFEYIKMLKEHGLDAIEVYHTKHNLEYSNKLITFCNKLELLQSGGTDYHGPVVKPNIEIGTGKNGSMKITDLSILSKIVR